jgi:uncharacterized UPF0160 family protein
MITFLNKRIIQWPKQLHRINQLIAQEEHILNLQVHLPSSLQVVDLEKKSQYELFYFFLVFALLQEIFLILRLEFFNFREPLLNALR